MLLVYEALSYYASVGLPLEVDSTNALRGTLLDTVGDG